IRIWQIAQVFQVLGDDRELFGEGGEDGLEAGERVAENCGRERVRGERAEGFIDLLFKALRIANPALGQLDVGAHECLYLPAAMLQSGGGRDQQGGGGAAGGPEGSLLREEGSAAPPSEPRAPPPPH